MVLAVYHLNPLCLSAVFLFSHDRFCFRKSSVSTEMRTLLLIFAAAEARGFAVHQSGAVLPGIRPIAAVATPLSPKMLAVAGSLPVEYNGCAAVMGGYVMIYYVNMWLSAGTPTDACPAQTTWGNRIFLSQHGRASSVVLKRIINK